jgi:hypothetical protein
MRTFGAWLMFYLICECYSSTAAAQHSSKATGCSSCFNAGRNSNRHEKLSFAYFHMTRWELLPILSYRCPLWLLPLAAASFDCWLMLPSVTSFGHWLTNTFNTPLNAAAIHWLLSSTLIAACIGRCSASFGLRTCWLAFCQVTFNATFKIPSRSSTFHVYQTRYENYIIISTSIFELTANLGAPPNFNFRLNLPFRSL